MEIHAFNRDVDDSNDRIHEKSLLMSVEDYGKDLTAVETLQRKQDTMEQDMTAIEEKIKVSKPDPTIFLVSTHLQI